MDNDHKHCSAENASAIPADTKDMTNIVSRLRNFAVWNNRQSHYEPVPLCKEAADEIEKLHRNLRHWREECGKLHAHMPTEPQEVSVWQPIETAPKVGEFLVYLPEEHRKFQVMYRNERMTVIGGAFGFDISKPTLWQPITEPSSPLPRPQSSLGQPLTVLTVDLLNPVAGDAK